MTDKEIEKIYKAIKEYHNKYLSGKGVLLPTLKESSGYTKNALVLVRLAKNYPNTDVVSKKELTDFVREFHPDVIDVQQARHLAGTSGWYIVSGTRGESIKLPKGSYKLISLEKPHPMFVGNRKSGVDSSDFEAIKKEYGYRCAVCGSQEGENHLIRKEVKVTLQKGHMDPSKDLVAGNIIPQCQICNRPDRNRWIYDRTGRVIDVADTPDGKRVVLRFFQKTTPSVRSELWDVLNEIVGKGDKK